MSKRNVREQAEEALGLWTSRPSTWRGSLFRFRHVVLAIALAACGGTVGQRNAGGESHFLDVCTSSCKGGLECISGLCTRGCLVDGGDCADLAAGAVCTTQSTEQTRGLVCDLECKRDGDCTALGDGFACSAGFCRIGSAIKQPTGAAGAAGAPSEEPFDPQCAEPPGFSSDCSLQATCEQLGCGDGVSQFDAQGCTRYCKASGDCAAGQRCRYTSLVVSENECPANGSQVEGCTLSDGTCSCATSDDCPHPDVCVDSAAYPESLDCVVAGASCQALNFTKFTLQERVTTGESPEKADVIAACLAAIQNEQVAVGCSKDLPFSCAESYPFSNECSFEATCKELHCGEQFSQFDTQGCLRDCKTSADCADGERCRHTAFIIDESSCAPIGSEVEGCAVVDGGCQCSTTDDCIRPDICVDATAYPESSDCAVEGASCRALSASADWMDNVSLSADDALVEAAATCLDKIRAEQQAQACP
jgi:hypothetical protein